MNIGEIEDDPFNDGSLFHILFIFIGTVVVTSGFKLLLIEAVTNRARAIGIVFGVSTMTFPSPRLVRDAVGKLVTLLTRETIKPGTFGVVVG